MQAIQTVELRDPPAHQFVVQASVPILGGADNLTLMLDSYPTDTRVIAHARGWTIYEVCAVANAGDASFDVRPGPRAPLSLVSDLQRIAVIPNLIRLRIDGREFSLTGQPGVFHRRGNVYRQSSHHVSLGEDGWAWVWIGMRAATNQLDFCVYLHNGIPGPDRGFSSVEVLVPNGAVWTPHLPDSVSQPPYLIKPGNYVLPQMFGRPFWFSVHPTSVIPEPEYVGMADWGAGGFLPSAFAVPEIQGAGVPLADARHSLWNLRPDPEYTTAPTGALWPASRYSGSVDRYPLDGVQWASSGDSGGLEYYRIVLLRGCARRRVRFDYDGGPLRLDSYAPFDWRFFDGFLGGRDAPWEWDRWSPQWTTPDPRTFPDFDQASLIRGLNENWVLVWLANDPLARLLALEGAVRSRMTFWEGPGRAHNLDVPVEAGEGSSIGVWEANAALAIAFARCIGATEYEPWTSVFIEHVRKVQMPSGCIVARVGGYPSDHNPFFGQYALQGATEFILLQLGLYSLVADDIVRRCARGMVGLATDAIGPGEDPGLYYFTATGFVDGECFWSDLDWPAELDELMGAGEEPEEDSSYYTAFEMGIPVALANAVGAQEAGELLIRFTGKQTVAEAIQYMKTWGLQAPSAQTDAPIENWWVALSEWTK